jgi:hypothetical protein
MQGHSQSTSQSVIGCSGSAAQFVFISVNILYIQSLALVNCHVRVQGTNASRVSISHVNFNTLALNIRSSDYVNISHSTLQGQVRAGHMMNISNVNNLDFSFCNITDIIGSSYSPVLMFMDVHVIQIFWCSIENVSEGSSILEGQTAENIQIAYSTFNENFRRVIKLIAVDNITITSSTFNYNTINGYFGTVIELSTADYIRIVSSTFYDNTLNYWYGNAVVKLRAVGNVHVASSTFNGSTFNGSYGMVVELDTSRNVYIVSSTFSDNYFDGRGYLINTYNSDVALISCSTMESNSVGSGALVRIDVSTYRDYNDPFCSLATIMRYGIIANSTFVYNDISHYGRAVDCNSCSIISSVFEQNVGRGSLFRTTNYLSILASHIAYNLLPQLLHYSGSAAVAASFDCSYFTSNIPQNITSKNSTSCNQLLVPGESAVCQHDSCDSEGKCVKCIYCMQCDYVLTRN